MGAKIHKTIIFYNESKHNIFTCLGKQCQKKLKTKTKVYKRNAL